MRSYVNYLLPGLLNQWQTIGSLLVSTPFGKVKKDNDVSISWTSAHTTKNADNPLAKGNAAADRLAARGSKYFLPSPAQHRYPTKYCPPRRSSSHALLRRTRGERGSPAPYEPQVTPV